MYKHSFDDNCSAQTCNFSKYFKENKQIYGIWIFWKSITAFGFDFLEMHANMPGVGVGAGFDFLEMHANMPLGVGVGGGNAYTEKKWLLFVSFQYVLPPATCIHAFLENQIQTHEFLRKRLPRYSCMNKSQAAKRYLIFAFSWYSAPFRLKNLWHQQMDISAPG